jgi:hypothetical protein
MLVVRVALVGWITAASLAPARAVQASSIAVVRIGLVAFILSLLNKVEGE